MTTCGPLGMGLTPKTFHGLGVLLGKIWLLCYKRQFSLAKRIFRTCYQVHGVPKN